MLDKADAVIRRISTNAAVFCVIAFLGLTFLTCADVFGRFAFNKPIPGAVEISSTLLPWVVFIGFAYALIQGQHVRLTLFTERLSQRAQLYLDILACIIGVIIFATVTYLGWLRFWDSFVIREVFDAPIPVPWYMAKLAFPIGMFIMFLQFLSVLLLNLKRLSTEKKE